MAQAEAEEITSAAILQGLALSRQSKAARVPRRRVCQVFFCRVTEQALWHAEEAAAQAVMELQLGVAAMRRLDVAVAEEAGVQAARAGRVETAEPPWW